MYYFFLIAFILSSSFLNAMQSTNFQIVPDAKGSYSTMDNCGWIARQAYLNGRPDIALEWFKKGRPDSAELFKKIEEIEDISHRKSTLQLYVDYLFASSQWNYLKTIREDDQVYIGYIEESIVPVFIKILDKKPNNSIEKEILDKTIGIVEDNSRMWLVGHLYHNDRPDSAVTYFKQSMKDKESSELLSQINGIQDEQKRENALQGYWHYLCGTTMIKEAQSEPKITDKCQQIIAKAFRCALATKVDTTQVQEIVRDTLKQLDSFTTTHACLYTGWEVMAYRFKMGKNIPRALRELEACINWDEKDGFNYSQQAMGYLFTSPAYNQIVSFDPLKIDDPLHRSFFLQKISQLTFAHLYFTSNLSSESIKSPLAQAEEAARIMTLIMTDPTFTDLPSYATQLNMRWWKSILEAKQKFYQLKEDLDKPHTKKRTKIKVKMISKYLDQFPDMDINSVELFVTQILRKNPDIAEHDFSRTNPVRRVFAFKKFMDEKSSLKDREDAITTLQALEVTGDIYAQNMLGIMCTYPHYTQLLSPKRKQYKQIGVHALTKAAQRANVLEPQAKTIQEYNKEIIPLYNTDGAFKNYLPLQGNCYIHAELVKMHACFGALDKMRDHAENMFDTCYLGKKNSQKFLTNSMNDLFGILGICVAQANGLKSFIEAMEKKASKHNIKIKELENYKTLKIEQADQNQTTNQNT